MNWQQHLEAAEKALLLGDTAVDADIRLSAAELAEAHLDAAQFLRSVTGRRYPNEAQLHRDETREQRGVR